MSERIALGDGDGEHLWYDGGLLTFKATGAQTEGALLLFEVRMPRGKATPLHVHHDADETFCLLDGELAVHCDGEDATVATGAVLSAPRGAPHAFAVLSDEARILVMLTPASSIQEEFFRRAGQPAEDISQPPPPADFERFQAAAQAAGLEILGPPPFAMAEG